MSETRRRILDTSLELLADHGFSGTSLQRIANAVGLRKASLLYHFPSKAALRDAVLADLFTGWSELLPQILAQDTDGDGRFQITMGATFAFFSANPNRARFIMRELLDNPEGLSKRLQTTLAPWLQAFTASLKKGQKLALVPADLDPQAYIAHTATLALASQAIGEAARGLLGDDTIDQQRLTNEAMRMTRAALFQQG